MSATSLGRYRLIAEIGRGGMADIYLAVTTGPEGAPGFRKLLVVKVLKRELADDPEFVKMFTDEARLAARLNHPNVVQTVEVGEDGGRHFLAMEYLDGQPLHRIFQSPEAQRRMNLAMRLTIMARALAGLHYAHDLADYDGTPLHVVHRDVSPANLFVTYDGQVKLVDFGIAKARDSNTETHIGVFKGKAAYIAPEQARGEPADRGADIYSAGVVLWELATARRMWRGLTQTETLQKVLAGDVPRPSTVDPKVAPELERICMKALAFRREDRYSSARDLATDIERIIRRYPQVSDLEIGKALAESFAESRAHIREVIEGQLSTSRKANSDAPLPALRLSSEPAPPNPLSPELPDGSLGSYRTARERVPSSGPAPASGAVAPSSSSGPATPSIAASPAPRRTVGVAAGVVAVCAIGGAAILGNRHANRSDLVAPSSAPSAATAAADAPPPARGVTDKEIKIGMSAVFSGPSRDLGENMKLGVETAFHAVNEAGGIYGRKLSLVALDDGYEATRVADTMKELLEQRGVFAFLGNVGTPTSAVAAPYAAQNKTIFFGAFTGAPALRQDPPDRYVFNYRASYKEETARAIKYLIENRKVAPEQIVVFAQDDSFGDAGFEGVAKALRGYARSTDVLRVGYKRNTVDVDEALSEVLKYNDKSELVHYGSGPNETHWVPRHPVKAVVMVATYRPAAKFIQKARQSRRLDGAVFFNVSFVGSEMLADELKSIDPSLCANTYVTQVVPPFDSGATGVLRYREQLASYQPQAHPGFVSLEGYVVGSIFSDALKRAGKNLTTERLVDTLEQISDLDLGLGAKITYSLSEHQGSHKVWGTRLDESCSYKVVDLD